MKTVQEIIKILRQYKQEAATKYGINKLGIFGSFARGEQTQDSDLDVFVDIQVPNPYYLGDIHDDLEERTGYKIDLLRLRDNLNSLLYQNILKDEILV